MAIPRLASNASRMTRAEEADELAPPHHPHGPDVVGKRAPGDPNGVGSASLDIGVDGICWDISVSNIDLQDFHVHAYIHEGQHGEVGPMVVDLTVIDPTGESNGCYPNRIVNAAETLPDILAHPDHYYVEITNQQFPKGAVRGQISGN